MRRKSGKGHHGTLDQDPLEDLEPTSIGAKPVHPRDLVGRKTPALSDRRVWAPRLKGEIQREPAREAGGLPARIRLRTASPKVRRGPGGKPLRSRPTSLLAKTTERFGFADVRKTTICLKRKMRRSVLFAHRKTGRGAKARRHRNEYSNINC